jgi:SCY1-like protein 2
MLPVMDFSMLKNDLFPVIASVFSKTSSLGIKVRGLEAFAILCGSSKEASTSPDDLDGIMVDDRKQDKRQNTNPVLDKYTIQEKLIPLMKAIKTKEPAVMVC